MLLTELKKRKESLESIIDECNWKLSHAPDGKLKVSKSKGTFYYYVRQSKADKEGKYLKYEQNRSLITKLAEKDYAIRTLNAAAKELEAVKKMIEIEEERPVEKVYSDLQPGRRELVKPYEEPLDDRIQRWESTKPDVMDSYPGSYVIKTKNGEYVRSKAEYNIANSLLKAGIPYKYETTYLTLDGVNEKPDFEIMSPTTGEIFYWEHFGMMDKPRYQSKMMDKLNGYEMSGLYPGKGLIVTFDDGSHPLQQEHIDRIINDLLR